MKIKKYNAKLIYILLILVAILGLSVVYAALSSTLNITGSTEITESSWDITLDVSHKASSTGFFSKSIPQVDGHRIKMYGVTANMPGDYAEVYITAHNNGTIIAELTDIIVGTPTCSSETGNTADEELVCNNIYFSYKYYDGTAVEKGDLLYPIPELGEFSGICKQSDSNNGNYYSFLSASQRRIVFRIDYNKDVDAVPSSNVIVNDIDIDLVFNQTQKSCPFNIP